MRNRRGGEWAGGICSTFQGCLGNAADFRKGYCKVSLCLAGSSRRALVSVHRLVALAFVEGDHSLEVNHKDLDKMNNRPDNLEWVTHAANIRHGQENNPEWVRKLKEAVHARRRRVVCVDENGSRKQFRSLNDAGRAMGDRTKAANIKNSIDRGTTAYGFRWDYVDG